MGTYADIPIKRIEPHSRACARAVVFILGKTLLENQAADRFLFSFLKENHQLGSRDRRIISETLFSVLRWWGWLKHLAPQEFLEALDSRMVLNCEDSGSEWYPCLAASWLLEGRPELPPSASWWLYKSNIEAGDIPKLQPNSSIQERRRCLRPFFGKGAELPPMPLEALLPDWSLGEIACPEDMAVLLDWMQRRPPVWLRAQTNDLDRLVGEFSREEVRLSRHPLMKHALKAVFAGVNLRQMPAFLEGRFEIQDLASQAIGAVCNPKPGEQWWDCCAGAGGKTLHLAWMMNGQGKIQATDNRVYKLEDLKQRARRCGRSNIIYKEWLGVPVPRLDRHFSGVLVDAPCSCSGTWRRNPGAKWTTKHEDVDNITALQFQLLENASRALAPGGTLVYATCSMFDRENQGIVRQFLAKYGEEFSLVPFQSPLTGKDTDGILQVWPWDGDCDAMFIAKFTRRA